MNIGAIIVCAGKGKRLGHKDKAVLKLNNKPLFYLTYQSFAKIPQIKQIVIVLRQENFSLARKLINDEKVIFTCGGKERSDSVYRGLESLDKNINYVLIHDGARPFAGNKLILNIIKELKSNPAVICGIKAKDTLKTVDQEIVVKTLDRSNVFYIQTPQGFRKDLILQAYAKNKNQNAFDDSQVLEQFGVPVKVIDGSNINFKITYPEDVILAKALLKADQRL